MRKIIKILAFFFIVSIFFNTHNFIYSQDSNDEVKDLNRQIQLKKEEAKK